MKTPFYAKTVIALAVAVAAAAGAVSQAQEQPMPPPADDSALPADIVPGSPLADVVKMIQAGVAADTINSYIVNSQSAFNLDADKIVFLKDEGVPSDLVNAMMERDKALYAATVTPAPAPTPVPAPAPASDVASSPDTAPPATEVTDTYFNDTLTPYGSWVDVEGYGRCWRPTVVNYDSAWRPYCDRGHWVYTDYGWYWDSDYSWGVTFHYGRWFRDSRIGWCWYPDTVWAPSWVTWRSDNDYCGWAPLPPLAVFRPGLGFFYRGVGVGVDFDFGLDAGCFTFISPEHFCDRRPRYYCAPRERVAQIFHQSREVNNFDVHGRTMMNRGISVEHITSATHRPLEPIHVGSLPNAGRQGWRGEGFDRSPAHGAVDNRNFPNGNGQLHHGPAMRNDPNHDANNNHRQNFGQPAQVPHPNGNPTAPPHSQPLEQPGNHNGQGDHGAAIHNPNQLPQPGVNPPANYNNRQNAYHPPPPSPPRQFNAPVAPSHSVPQNDQRQSRSMGAPALAMPPQRSAPQVEQRQFVAPPVPSAPRTVAPAPRSSSPPPQPAPAPAQSQPRNAGNGSNNDKQHH